MRRTIPPSASLVAVNHLFLHLNKGVTDALGILNTSKQDTEKTRKQIWFSHLFALLPLSPLHSSLISITAQWI